MDFGKFENGVDWSMEAPPIGISLAARSSPSALEPGGIEEALHATQSAGRHHAYNP